MSRVRHQQASFVLVALRRGEHICFLERTGTGWMDEYFSLPAGGVEADETLAEAATREVWEEVGVHVERLSLVHTVHCRLAGDECLGHLFEAEAWAGEPVVREPEKHGRLIWANLGEVPGDIVPYVRQALEAVQRGERYSEYGWEGRG